MNEQNHTPITDQQFFDFVKKNEFEKLDDPLSILPSTKKYLNLHRKHGQRFFISWNWAAMFSNGWQLFYRKLYLLSFIASSIELIFLYGLQIKIWDYHKTHNELYTLYLDNIMFLISTLLYGLFSNWLYLNHVRRCIIKGQFSKRGVSLTYTLTATVLFCLLTCGYEYYFMK